MLVFSKLDQLSSSPGKPGSIVFKKSALLAILLISALAPAQKLHDAHRDPHDSSNRNSKHKREVVAVPEGGAAFAYFAMSGAAAAAAVWVSRKRRRGAV